MKKCFGTGCIILSLLLLTACVQADSLAVPAQADQTPLQDMAEPAATEPQEPTETEKPEITHSATPTAQPIATIRPKPFEIPIPEGIKEAKVFFSESRQKNYTVIAKSGLVVRNQPDTSGEKIDVLKTDMVVQAIGDACDGAGLWVLVRYEGNYGWVSGNYLRAEQRPKPEGVAITEEEAKLFFDTYVCPKMIWVDTQNGMEGVFTQHPEMGIDQAEGGTRCFILEKLLAADGQQAILNDRGDLVINQANLQDLLDRVYGKNCMDAENWGRLQNDSIVVEALDGMGGLYPSNYAKYEDVLVEGSLATIQLRVAQDGMDVYDYAEVMVTGTKNEPVVTDEQRTTGWDEVESFEDLCQSENLNEEDFGIVDVVLFKDEAGVHLWGAFPEEQVNYPW